MICSNNAGTFASKVGRPCSSSKEPFPRIFSRWERSEAIDNTASLAFLGFFAGRGSLLLVRIRGCISNCCTRTRAWTIKKKNRMCRQQRKTRKVYPDVKCRERKQVPPLQSGSQRSELGCHEPRGPQNFLKLPHTGSREEGMPHTK